MYNCGCRLTGISRSNSSRTIHVIGLFTNGANGAVLTQGTTAVVNKTFAYDSANKKVTVPGSAVTFEEFDTVQVLIGLVPGVIK